MSRARSHLETQWRDCAADNGFSDLSTIVGPVEQRLSLSRSTQPISWIAMPLNLCDMPTNCFPAPDLACVLVGHPAAHIIAAIPLKPAARIIGVDPAFLTPHR